MLCKSSMWRSVPKIMFMLAMSFGGQGAQYGQHILPTLQCEWAQLKTRQKSRASSFISMRACLRLTRARCLTITRWIRMQNQYAYHRGPLVSLLNRWHVSCNSSNNDS